jgi:hypothetical protein
LGGDAVAAAGLAGLALHRAERARRKVEAALGGLSALDARLARRRGASDPALADAMRLLEESLGDLERLQHLLARLAREAAGVEVSLYECRGEVEGPQAVIRPGRGGEVAVELCESGCGRCEEHTLTPGRLHP